MIRIAMLAAAGLALTGCANLDALGRPGGVGEKVLDNLEGCARTYRGAIGAGVTGSFEITCQPGQTEAQRKALDEAVAKALEPR